MFIYVQTHFFPKKITGAKILLACDVLARSLPSRRNRTRRVDKGKSGQAQKTAVSGGFGGGILSQNLKQVFDSFGGTE